jgi:N-acetyl sugar amidotransferase
MIRCTRCNLPETYETIEFDAQGVCNICRAHSNKHEAADWSDKRVELSKLIEHYRGRAAYDCIVPFSGGKDSTFTLWYLVHHYRLKVLVVQFDHGFLRKQVSDNNTRTLRILGCDAHRFSPNWRLVRRVMLEALARKGDFCWHCHTGIFAYPMQVALKEQVPLIIWGEPSTEYTQYYQEGETEEVDETRFDRFVNLGITADDMAGMIKKDFNFDYRDLKPFTYPPASELRKLGVRSICLGSYIRWDVKKQTEIIQKELGWEGDDVEGMPKGRWPYEKIECSMQGVRDYIKHLKRGYSRISQMCALDIRNGRMTTEEAKKLAASEGMKPRSLELFLEYIGITEDEFNEYIRATVVSPHVPDFGRSKGDAPHDFKEWYREPCSQKG